MLFSFPGLVWKDDPEAVKSPEEKSVVLYTGVRPRRWRKSKKVAAVYASIFKKNPDLVRLVSEMEDTWARAQHTFTTSVCLAQGDIQELAEITGTKNLQYRVHWTLTEDMNGDVQQLTLMPNMIRADKLDTYTPNKLSEVWSHWR